MVFARSIFSAAFFACCTASSAFAATIQYNADIGLGVSYALGTFASVNGDAPVGQSFTASGTDFVLADVKLMLSADPLSAGSFVVTLNPDSGGSPDLVTAILTLGTVLDASLTSTPAFMDFFGQGYLLTAGARYWIVATDADSSASPASPTTAMWEQASGTIGPTYVGVDAESAYAQDGSYPVSTTTPDGLGGFLDQAGNALVMTVETVETPEPVSIALLGVGLAGLGWARSRRKRAASAV